MVKVLFFKFKNKIEILSRITLISIVL